MTIFLDASYYLALYNIQDPYHTKAVALARRIDSNEFGLVISSDNVFDEVVSVALRKHGKEEALIYATNILKGSILIHTDVHIFTEAYEIFINTKENFSFTDCTVLAIMKFLDIKEIATFDYKLEKAILTHS